VGAKDPFELAGGAEEFDDSVLVAHGDDDRVIAWVFDEGIEWDQSTRKDCPWRSKVADPPGSSTSISRHELRSGALVAGEWWRIFPQRLVQTLAVCRGAFGFDELVGKLVTLSVAALK